MYVKNSGVYIASKQLTGLFVEIAQGIETENKNENTGPLRICYL